MNTKPEVVDIVPEYSTPTKPVQRDLGATRDIIRTWLAQRLPGA